MGSCYVLHNLETTSENDMANEFIKYFYDII